MVEAAIDPELVVNQFNFGATEAVELPLVEEAVNPAEANKLPVVEEVMEYGGSRIG